MSLGLMIHLGPEERLSREELNIGIACLIAQRGTCLRARVGAVLVKDKRIIASGYNGPPPGSKHCEELGCNLEEKCQQAIHAEHNLINWAMDNKIGMVGTHLYCTHCPCIDCAGFIKYAGIKGVTFLYKYRDSLGYDYLLNHNIFIKQIDDVRIQTQDSRQQQRFEDPYSIL